MGNRRAREWRKREDLRESKRIAREVPRSIFADVAWQGAGLRVLQVVHEPSFDPGFAWEICELEDGFAVYRSSVETGGLWWAQLRGYIQLAVSSDKLQSYWEEVRTITVDLAALDDPVYGLDGEFFQLALWAGFTSVRFLWWGTSPPNWEPLDRIAWEMMDTFREAAEIGEP